MTLRAEPDWDTVDLALPQHADTARAALRHARRRYDDVLQQLEELVEYRHRHASGAGSASGSTGGGSGTTGKRPHEPSPPQQHQPASGDGGGSRASSVVTFKDLQQQQQQQHLSPAPRGVTHEMIPHTDLSPRPSARLRRGTSFVPSQSMGGGGSRSGDCSGASSPAPRQPSNHPRRTDCTVPLQYQRRPAFGGARTRHRNIGVVNPPSPFSASLMHEQQHNNTTSTTQHAGGGDSVAVVHRGYRFPHEQQPTVASTARDALLVIALAGTLVTAAVKLNLLKL